MSRVDAIAKNMKFAAISQVMIILFNFFVRKVFIVSLGAEYLGLNGLFTDILSMLSLAELGFGTSVIYSLYKPVAEDDHEKIKTLMAFYKKVYSFIGIIVFAAGVALAPFLEFFVNEMPDNIPHIRFIFLLNVINSSLSYFFIYKASLLYVYQKKYVELVINTAVKLVSSVIQIGVLLFTHSYIGYMIVILCGTMIQNLSISYKADQMYPYLKDKDVKSIDREDLREIKKNMGAMIFHKIGNVMIFSTDNILMAKFVSIVAVGIYSNYMMIRKALLGVVELLFVSLNASYGNLNAVENDEKKREAFDNLNFFAAWLFGFMSICLWVLYNPFLTLWLGKDYIFGPSIVIVIVFNFYMYCMRLPISSIRDTMGLFWHDRYKPIAEVLINLGASVILAQRIGIAGILWGTLISTVTVPFIVEPIIIYKYGLHESFLHYYQMYLKYLVITMGVGAVTAALANMTPDGFVGFGMKLVLCAFVPNILYLLIYRKVKEFKYLESVAFRLANKVLHIHKEVKS